MAALRRFNVFTPADVLIGDAVENRDGSITIGLTKGSAHLIFSTGTGKLRLTEKVDRIGGPGEPPPSSPGGRAA